jgi:hypothetical protein
VPYPISDDFNDPRGRWQQIAPWDGTEHSDSDKGFIATQEHVDLRSFRDIADLVPVPQTDLEAVTQTVLDGETQTAMEVKLGTNVLAENWSLTVTTGTNNNLVVGKQAALNDWSGASFTLSGAALAATLESVIATKIDISNENFLSVVFPGHITFGNTSYIQLCSSPLGFGHSADSAQVPFSANTASLPELRVAMAAFAAAGFDNTQVTGVRLHFVEAAPTPGAQVFVTAIRAVKTGWVASALDFDTRLGALVQPVTLDGNAYSGTTAVNFEFVRGDLSKNDPIPADQSVNLFFYPGGTSANLATGASYNKLSVILRETKDAGDGLGSHIEVSLLFNDTNTNIEVKRVDSTGGSPGTTTNHGLYDAVVGAALDSLKHYLFHIDLKGTQVSAALYETDVDLKVGDLLWQNTDTITDTNYTYRNGRVGFIATLLTRDAYLDEIAVAPTGFASLTTEVFESRSPVDGAQLAAIYAADENLFNTFTGSDVFIDQTKTLSGLGSYRSTAGLTSNSFIIDDWTESYLDFAIWVSNSVTLSNQPKVVLNTDSGAENIPVARLQPAQWNFLHFDLGILRNLLTGIAYSISILPADDPDKALGNFWVDDVTIGRRRIAWSLRATANGPWRKFKDLVNKPNGAVHFPANERGTELQLRAEALTQDAWVSSFKLFPRYAQLGLPVWDQAFQTR